MVPATGQTTAVIVITGGSEGTGRALARELAGRGDAVVMVYLWDQRQAEAAVEEILLARGTAMVVRADLADDLDVERLFTETHAAFGEVDALVHTQACGASVLDGHAARWVRRGGVIIDLTDAHTVEPLLDHRLRTRGITVIQLGRRTHRPNGSDVGDLLTLMDRYRRDPL